MSLDLLSFRSWFSAGNVEASRTANAPPTTGAGSVKGGWKGPKGSLAETSYRPNRKEKPTNLRLLPRVSGQRDAGPPPSAPNGRRGQNETPPSGPSLPRINSLDLSGPGRAPVLHAGGYTGTRRCGPSRVWSSPLPRATSQTPLSPGSPVLTALKEEDGNHRPVRGGRDSSPVIAGVRDRKRL